MLLVLDLRIQHKHPAGRALTSEGPFTLRLCLQFASNAMNGFYTHSLHLTQHPIDAMLQFDANANAHANVDASVNEA